MTTQEAFWSWFLEHEAEFFGFDPTQESEREELFDRVALELQKVHKNLTFEFGPRGQTREFVISAGGIRKAFPAVLQLAGDAPKLERWRVTAFRPRRTPLITVEINGKCVDAADVRFSLLDNGETPGVYLFIPGYQEDDVDFKQMGYLLLDESLGEFDVETRLGLIKMFPPEHQAEGVRHPFPELPERFDRLKSRLGEHSTFVSPRPHAVQPR